MKILTLATDLALPLDAVTEKLAFLGRTGSGKTYAAMKLAELMLEAGAHVGAIDPVGVWRALRVPAKGHSRAFPVVVFGGLYGDVPLTPTAGAVVADVVTDRALSFVLDISQMIPSEQQRLVHDFGDRFFQRRKAAPSAVHLFLEECQEYIPENPSGAEARTLGVMQRLVEAGPQLRDRRQPHQPAPPGDREEGAEHERDALRVPDDGPAGTEGGQRTWVADAGVDVDIERVLQRLEIGTPHVESPTFLKCSRTVRVLPRVTADLSSTPKVGAAGSTAKPLTPIDVAQLTKAMATAIEQAKADDPKELRKRITELERQLTSPSQGRNALHAPPPAPKIVEKPVITDAQLARAEALIGQVDAAIARAAALVAKPLDKLKAQIGELTQAVQAVRQPALPLPVARTPVIRPPKDISPKPQASTLPPARQKVLNALAFLRGIGVTPADKTQLALFVGVSPTSGGYFNNLGALRSEGYITYPSGGTVDLTDQGAAVAVVDGVPTTTGELHELLRQKLPPAKWKVLEAIIAAYPDAKTKDAIAAAVNVSPTSGGYFNNLGSLRSLGLIDYPQPGYVVARRILFLED